MHRAIKVTLKFVTAKKRRAISALLSRYRAAVNFYIRSLWDTKGKLDKATIERLTSTELTLRYKAKALHQALKIVVMTRRKAKQLGKMVTCPVFSGAALLDAGFITIAEGKGTFDLVIKLSSLLPGQRITIPTRKTAVYNKWMAQPGAKLIQGCALTEESIVIWVDVPDSTPKLEGTTLGVDIGINKLLADSNGNFYGQDFKRIRDKILRKRPGSQGRKRAATERDNYICHVVKQLPWSQLSAIGVEDLTNLKKGKKKNRSKAFRKAIAPWTYRRVLNWIEYNAQANRVRLVRVNPANTSRECPVCGECSTLNRRGEKFLCISCGHKADADTIGAQNILDRTLAILGSLESPGLKKGDASS